MMDEKKDNMKNAEEADVMTEEATGEAAPETKAEASETPDCSAELKKLRDGLAESEEKLSDMTDRYTRMLAEYDNFRRRAAKEREGIYSDAYGDALMQLLPIKDTLELAVKYTDAEKFADGVILTLSKFDDVLTKLGIEAIGVVGEAFDPMKHNAIMHIDDETYGESTVCEIIQKGYRRGDKIIRYALVKVAN